MEWRECAAANGVGAGSVARGRPQTDIFFATQSSDLRAENWGLTPFSRREAGRTSLSQAELGLDRAARACGVWTELSVPARLTSCESLAKKAACPSFQRQGYSIPVERREPLSLQNRSAHR